MQIATRIIATTLALGLTLLTLGCDVINARQAAREGNEAYMAFDYSTAIGKYLEAEKLDPQTPNLYLNLGYSYFSIYDPTSEKDDAKAAADKAVNAFEKHLAHNPEDDGARIFQIKTLIKAAPHDKTMADRALKTFLDMLKENPKDHEARQYLITLFIDCHRYQDAVAFFEQGLEKNPQDIETMKILAIIADKSQQTQAAVDWYFRRAEAIADPAKKATLLYEVGTYCWNLLHYQPDRHTGVEAIKLADQGIEACLKAMALKEKYAEAMIYGNLLYLKRAMYDGDEQGRALSQVAAFDLRKQAGKILMERKAAKAAEQAKNKDGERPEGEDGAPAENENKETADKKEGSTAGGAGGNAPAHEIENGSHETP